MHFKTYNYNQKKNFRLSSHFVIISEQMARLSVLSTVKLITQSDPNTWMQYIINNKALFHWTGLETWMAPRPSAKLKTMYIVQWNNKIKQITNSPNYHRFQSLLHFTPYHIPIFLFTNQFNSSKAHKPTKPVPKSIFRNRNFKKT